MSKDDRHTFVYRGRTYPTLLKEWGMSRYIAPLALKFCAGKGVDIGAGDDPFPGATSVDLRNGNGYHALELPAKENELDYVFSSHCLEHVSDFVGALTHWISRLKSGGVLFLYLPSWECEYWRPWNNRKHLHQFEPKHIEDCLRTLGLKDVMVSGVDLAYSFSAVGFKPES